MRIAVIGSGISGLTVAHHLAPIHDVTLLEQDHRLGGHTHTVDVEVDRTRYAIDTGFIVFNDRTYPLFQTLLQELGVPTQPTWMGFSVRCERSGLEYSGSGLNGLFAQRRNILNFAFHRLVRDFFRFQRISAAWLARTDDCTTIRDFFSQHHFSQEFQDLYFLPMASAIWSCPRQSIERFPIEFVLRFYHHHGLLGLWNRPQWFVIRGGSRVYIHELLRRFRGAVELNSPVESLRRVSQGVELFLRGGWNRFDHVILACHADQALRILGDNASQTEQELLSAFPYERNDVTLHTDARLLPQSRRAWASWNYFLPSQDPGKTTVTYNMNMLQGLPRRAPTFCVTLNGEHAIRPETVLRRFRYDHPVFNLRRQSAQQRHGDLVGHHGVSYCGAYWGNGFHEDGVRSALKVCDWIKLENSRQARVPQVTAT